MKIENTYVYGFETAFKAMRIPMDSIDKSDSEFDKGILGNKDLELAMSLIRQGNDHGKFTRFLTVTCEITAPRYWWQEFDTYKFVDKCSQSTMHKGLKFYTKDDFEIDFDKIPLPEFGTYLEMINNHVKHKNITTVKKLLPESLLQTRIVKMNYQTIRQIYKQRRHHTLGEWNYHFVTWVEGLPYANELITI